MAGRADDLGRLFEAGFMLGVVRALGTLPTPPPACWPAITCWLGT
jgi:hypothetical protein